LPADWVQALGLQGQIVLDKTSEGILVRPCPPVTWDDIFATRLTVRPGDPATVPEVTQVSGDDLLFQPRAGAWACHDGARVQPASRPARLAACELLLRAHTGWFTSASVLFEAKAVLTKVYGEDPALATQKLAQVAAGPVVLLDLDP